MKRFLVLAPILFWLLIPKSVCAWGKTGHQIVAQIAKAYITADVRDSVQKYLGDMSFESAATWMDEVRKDTTLNFMKPWHYVNIEKDKTYVKNNDENIINQLDIVISKLTTRSGLTSQEINNNLKVLFHLVGDIHQPLHAGYASDKGGNDIKVMFEGKEKNLHWAWDSEIIYSAKINYEKISELSNKLSEKKRKKIQNAEIGIWLNESRSYLPKIYKFKNKELDKKYIAKNSKIIESQLMKSGLRLAQILTNLFGKK